MDRALDGGPVCSDQGRRVLDWIGLGGMSGLRTRALSHAWEVVCSESASSVIVSSTKIDQPPFATLRVWSLCSQCAFQVPGSQCLCKSLSVCLSVSTGTDFRRSPNSTG